MHASDPPEVRGPSPNRGGEVSQVGPAGSPRLNENQVLIKTDPSKQTPYLEILAVLAAGLTGAQAELRLEPTESQPRWLPASRARAFPQSPGFEMQATKLGPPRC